VIDELSIEPVGPYFHGGAPGLRVGGYLLPPAVSGQQVTTHRANAALGAPGIARGDRVYVTTERDFAYVFAALYPLQRGGWVYQVEPEGVVEPDPDCNTPGLSWECERARIVRVWKVSGFKLSKVRRAAGRGEIG
jgi:rifampin ADP-ribosylating transferase